MDKMDNYYRDMIVSEVALAMKNPVLEAEYELSDEAPPLNLFDCILPKLKRYLKSKPAFT